MFTTLWVRNGFLHHRGDTISLLVRKIRATLESDIETHPFAPFVPRNPRFLILGSFTGRQATTSDPLFDPAYDWYYGTRRNQFWRILIGVYGIELHSKAAKQALFTQLGIAVADIIYKCERSSGSNLDANLANIVYNIAAIVPIIDDHKIVKIYFTSRFVERKFGKEFKAVIQCHPDIERIALPSPSPRYARMTLEQKIARYKELLPKI